MYSQTTKQRVRSSVSGRYKRNSVDDRIHQMIQSWASHILTRLGTSEGQGFSIGILQDYSGLPPHSLIPKGVEFTSPDDIAIENWVFQAPYQIQVNVRKKYLEAQKIKPSLHTELLKNAARYLFGY
jgi:hypothetical protein